MARYVTQPEPAKAHWDLWHAPHTVTNLTVMAPPPFDTTLLDQHGRRLYRVPNEIGFVPRKTVE